MNFKYFSSALCLSQSTYKLYEVASSEHIKYIYHVSQSKERTFFFVFALNLQFLSFFKIRALLRPLQIALWIKISSGFGAKYNNALLTIEKLVEKRLKLLLRLLSLILCRCVGHKYFPSNRKWSERKRMRVVKTINNGRVSRQRSEGETQRERMR